MATARDIIEASLREIGVLAASETATAEDASTALTRLNRYLDRLATERLSIYTVTRSTWTITSGTGAYNVASGQTVNIARPVHVENVKYQDTNTTPDSEYPLTKLTEQAYQAITFKAQTSEFPEAWYYNPTYPTAVLTLWPAPTSTKLEGVIYAWTAVAQLAALTTSVALPPGYEEMLVTNLAMLLCPTYERQPNPVLVRTAAESLASVKRANRRLQDMSFDPAALIGGGGRSYDIREG